MEGKKGIIQQILETGKPIVGGISYEDFLDAIEEAERRDREILKKHREVVKQNIAHLVKKEKELGKKAPVCLVFVASSYPQVLVGSDFIENYREWLDE